jgi:hypothetical protein
MKPALILVGADKGGVGKTTVSRILLDYLAERGVPTRAFDTEAPRGTLKRFYPHITEIVDMSRTADQMRIFDTLDADDAKVSLVDIRAGQLRMLIAKMREIGFLEAARQGEFHFVLVHILGSSVASLAEIADIAPNAPDDNYYVVKNLVGEASYFEWDPETYRSYFDAVRGAHEISIPKLNELAYSAIDLAGVPFSQFAYDGSESFVLRGYVRNWLQHVGAQFDAANMAGSLAAEPAAEPTPPEPPAATPPRHNLGQLEEILLERLRALDQAVKGN